MKRLILLFLGIFLQMGFVHVGDKIKATDMTSLRNKINAKRVCFGISVWNFTDESLALGMSIKRQHILEMRQAIDDLYAQCGNGACADSGIGNWEAITYPNWDSEALNSILAEHVNTVNSAIENIRCVETTFSWSVGAVTDCLGGNGLWLAQNWGACVGGNTRWNIGEWGGCSNACGDGTQTRNASCEYIPNSGWQTREVSCRIQALSGVGKREVKCLRSDNTVVPDYKCTDARPALEVSCTPTDIAVCGMRPADTQGCTPTSTAYCANAPSTSQACNGGGRPNYWGDEVPGVCLASCLRSITTSCIGNGRCGGECETGKSKTRQVDCSGELCGAGVDSGYGAGCGPY